MQKTLIERTLDLVRERGRGRGQIQPLADELGVPYHVIHRIIVGRTQTLDAGTCQHLYERLTGHTLDIR